jgi:hypothetical protein
MAKTIKYSTFVMRPQSYDVGNERNIYFQVENEDSDDHELRVKGFLVNDFEPKFPLQEKYPCIFDMTVGLSAEGDILVTMTSDGDGDGDMKIAIYPEESQETAVNLW